ncbi:hypothetical protein PRZ48_010436 [Zasmidium cellare]|uniref:Uncharacterized protein n=1 Tax=Zasmidium cellare TaxID=395010 RepID=A0ABR0E934_ZASCE|nr:hypothetical protein PRZ48_010436 [Zasmidium cellare]
MSSQAFGINCKSELEWDRSPHCKNKRELKFLKERIDQFATAILEDDWGCQKKRYTIRNGPPIDDDEWKALVKEQKDLYDRLHRVKAGKKVVNLAIARRHLDLAKEKAPGIYRQVLDEAKNKTKKNKMNSRTGGKKLKKVTKKAKTEYINDSITPSSDDKLGPGDKSASQIKFEPTFDGDEPQAKRQKTSVVEEDPALIPTT